MINHKCNTSCSSCNSNCTDFVDSYKNEELIRLIDNIRGKRTEENMGALLLYLINTTVTLPCRLINDKPHGFMIVSNNKAFLPVFSEIAELKKYMDFIKKEEEEKLGTKTHKEAVISIVSFTECMKIVKDNPEFSGIVLDPFNINIILERALIKNLIDTIDLSPVSSDKSDDNETFLTEIDDKTPFQNVINEVVDFAKKHKKIEQVYMLTGETYNKDKTRKRDEVYFIVDIGDLKEKETKELFDKLASCIAKVLKASFVLTPFRNNQHVKEIYNDNTLIYKK